MVAFIMVRSMLLEVPAISMEVLVEAADILIVLILLLAVSEAVGWEEWEEEEEEAGVVAAAERVAEILGMGKSTMAAPAVVADLFLRPLR